MSEKTRHPARFSDAIIPIVAGMLGDAANVLDPFAGVGKICQIRKHGYRGKIVCNELEAQKVERWAPWYTSLADRETSRPMHRSTFSLPAAGTLRLLHGSAWSVLVAGEESAMPIHQKPCPCGGTITALSPSALKRRKYCGYECPLNPQRQGLTLEERLVAGTGPALQTGCTEWMRSRASKGYGRIAVNGSSRLAHQIAYEIRKGPIPDGLLVLHTCDNPPCVNPAHLYAGTYADNNRDTVERGRHRAPTGVAHYAARLTENQVRAIRRRREAGESGAVLATEFGVTPKYIYKIHSRKVWRHLSSGKPTA